MSGILITIKLLEFPETAILQFHPSRKEIINMIGMYMMIMGMLKGLFSYK